MGLSYTAVSKKNQKHGRETEMLRSGDSPGVWFPFCESLPFHSASLHGHKVAMQPLGSWLDFVLFCRQLGTSQRHLGRDNFS